MQILFSTQPLIVSLEQETALQKIATSQDNFAEFCVDKDILGRYRLTYVDFVWKISMQPPFVCITRAIDSSFDCEVALKAQST